MRIVFLVLFYFLNVTNIFCQHIEIQRFVIVDNSRLVSGDATLLRGVSIPELSYGFNLGFELPRNIRITGSVSRYEPLVGMYLFDLVSLDPAEQNSISLGISAGESWMFGLGIGYNQKIISSRVFIEPSFLLNVQNYNDTSFDDKTGIRSSNGVVFGIVSDEPLEGVQLIPELSVKLRLRLFAGLHATALAGVRYGRHPNMTAEMDYYINNEFIETAKFEQTPTGYLYGYGLMYDFQWKKDKGGEKQEDTKRRRRKK